MTKNEILKTVIDNLMRQRDDLNSELCKLNHNEVSFNDRKLTLEVALSNIDMQIQNNIMSIEM